MTNLLLQVTKNMSSIFFSNSEAIPSELLENLKKMFPLYYMHSNVFSMLIIYSTTY